MHYESSKDLTPLLYTLKTMNIYQYQEQKCKKCDYTQNYIKPLFYVLRAWLISIYGLPDAQDTTEAD